MSSSAKKKASVLSTKKKPRRRAQLSGVGIREFRAHLSRYLKEAEAGKTVEIYRGAQCVGRLVPPPESTEHLWDRLVREGVMTPPSNKGPRVLPPPPLSAAHLGLLEALEEDRQDQRY